MESIKAEVRYSIYTKVIDVRERFKAVYLSGVGKDYKSVNESLGWYMYLEGSYEALHMGTEKPEFNPGDRVKITFEKVQDATSK